MHRKIWYNRLEREQESARSEYGEGKIMQVDNENELMDEEYQEQDLDIESLNLEQDEIGQEQSLEETGTKEETKEEEGTKKKMKCFEGREEFGNKKSLISILLFPIVFCYLEVVFHCLVFKKLDSNVIYSILTAIVAGLLITAITSLFQRKINCIISMILVSITCVWFCVQLVFQHIFRTFLTIYSVGENGTDVLEFWKDALHGILAKLPGILLLLLPIAVTAILIKKQQLLQKQHLAYAGINFGGAIVLHIIFLFALLVPGKAAHTPYDLYHNDFIQDLGIEKVGLLTATRMDIKNVFFGADDFEMDKDAFLSVDPVITTPTVLPTVTPVPLTQAPEATATPTPSPTPTPIPIDTSPNVLEIDFKQLAAEAKNKSISSLYEYFSNVTPTNKNEYTGMFEGYNLIYLTAEGFSPWAVDEKITPTLYKLTHSGFIFENFYNPIWWTSTSDGEYVGCTGLIPSGSNSMSKSANCDMPLCLGWQFKELGYSTRAYHNHSYKYYHRDLSHPNMGYDYKGANGGGLDMKSTWPESDLEMMQKTVSEYIGDEPFHTYYMTVSGHMEYTFVGNSMASKNRDYVKDLPYSDECKAYIACNKELDLALEYLISELDKAGVLDKTVIALSADHYPYGLAQDKINELAGHKVEENFELYKNYFVLWNSQITEPIVIDKYCSTVDIIPTLNNLFGIPYDSRLFMGQDILSDAPALVMTSNQSFITDYVKYNSKTGDCEMLQDVELPENYLKGYIAMVKNKFNVSGSVIKNNFYHDLLPHLNLTTY
ncbi:MAG: LTA synthase family protein, partial [Clostridiales bacterium]|nr:LTA synthase family protein [Clostridiales bacterium]